MEDGDTALAVGHSPVIELALLHLLGNLQPELAVLKEMDGVELNQYEQGKITVLCKLLAPQPERMREMFGAAFAAKK